MTKNLDLSLYLVTDSTYHTEESLLYTVEEACKGGVTLVQLREKNTGGRDYLEKACKIKKITDRYQVPLIIDDRADVAMACGAAGVHVGASDLPVAEVRRLLGPDKIVGATAKTVEAAKKAYEDGADYLGVGAVFHTDSKADAADISHETLKAITEAVDIPVIAIGGISKENVSELSGTGICGIAVISAIFAEKDIKNATKKLKKLTEEMVEA